MAQLTKRISQLFLVAIRNGTAIQPAAGNIGIKKIHTGAILNAGYEKPNGPQGFLRYNKTMFPPQQADEIPRPAVSIPCIFTRRIKM